MQTKVKKLGSSHHCKPFQLDRIVYNSKFNNFELFQSDVIKNLKKNPTLSKQLYSDVLRENDIISTSVAKSNSRKESGRKHVHRNVGDQKSVENSTFSPTLVHKKSVYNVMLQEGQMDTLFIVLLSIGPILRCYLDLPLLVSMSLIVKNLS